MHQVAESGSQILSQVDKQIFTGTQCISVLKRAASISCGHAFMPYGHQAGIPQAGHWRQLIYQSAGLHVSFQLLTPVCNAAAPSEDAHDCFHVNLRTCVNGALRAPEAGAPALLMA